MTRNNLGLAYAETERLPDAQSEHTEALALFRELDDPFGEANTLGHQAWVMDCLGRFREAVDLCLAASTSTLAKGSAGTLVQTKP